jgi:uncharacterized membrane protein YczE
LVRAFLRALSGVWGLIHVMSHHLHAGDRAADVPSVMGPDSTEQRLFEILRGTRHSLLVVIDNLHLQAVIHPPAGVGHRQVLLFVSSCHKVEVSVQLFTSGGKNTVVLIVRCFCFFIGCVLFALGNAIAVKVKYLGLHPWEVLNVALYQRFGLSIGTWNVICGLLLVSFLLFVAREYINLGTFLNAFLVGPSMDFFLWINILPDATNSWVDYLILLAGIIISGVGGGIYVAAGLGAGPRDGFMLSISDKTRLSVGNARIIVESLILLLGFLLGGPVFIVTFIYTFIQSPVFQKTREWLKVVLALFERKWAGQSSVPS